MKPIYLFPLLMALCCSSIEAQPITASFTNNSEVSIAGATLEEYRKNLWEMPPAAEGWVNDYAGLFTSEEETQLESVIAHLEKKSGVEIAIISLDSLMVARDRMEEYSSHVLKTWGIGKIAKDNGILISICRDYKLVKIVSGAGAVHYVSSTRKKSLVDFIIPFFNSNQYFDGTIKALRVIVKNIENSLYGFAVSR
jgi:uncharacterized membrane protein YgcG